MFGGVVGERDRRNTEADSGGAGESGKNGGDRATRLGDSV